MGHLFKKNITINNVILLITISFLIYLYAAANGLTLRWQGNKEKAQATYASAKNEPQPTAVPKPSSSPTPIQQNDHSDQQFDAQTNDHIIPTQAAQQLPITLPTQAQQQFIQVPPSVPALPVAKIDHAQLPALPPVVETKEIKGALPL